MLLRSPKLTKTFRSRQWGHFLIQLFPKNPFSETTVSSQDPKLENPDLTHSTKTKLCAPHQRAAGFLVRKEHPRPLRVAFTTLDAKLRIPNFFAIWKRSKEGESLICFALKTCMHQVPSKCQRVSGIWTRFSWVIIHKQWSTRCNARTWWIVTYRVVAITQSIESC